MCATGRRGSQICSLEGGSNVSQIHVVNLGILRLRHSFDADSKVLPRPIWKRTPTVGIGCRQSCFFRQLPSMRAFDGAEQSPERGRDARSGC